MCRHTCGLSAVWTDSCYTPHRAVCLHCWTWRVFDPGRGGGEGRGHVGAFCILFHNTFSCTHSYMHTHTTRSHTYTHRPRWYSLFFWWIIISWVEVVFVGGRKVNGLLWESLEHCPFEDFLCQLVLQQKGLEDGKKGSTLLREPETLHASCHCCTLV